MVRLREPFMSSLRLGLGLWLGSKNALPAISLPHALAVLYVQRHVFKQGSGWITFRMSRAHFNCAHNRVYGPAAGAKGVARQLPLPFARRTQLATHLCRGVSFLHSLSPPLLHRDLKVRLRLRLRA